MYPCVVYLRYGALDGTDLELSPSETTDVMGGLRSIEMAQLCDETSQAS